MKLTNTFELTMTKNEYGVIANHSKKHVERPFKINLNKGQTYEELFKGVTVDKYNDENNAPAIVLSNEKSLGWDYVEKIIEVNGIKFFQLKNDSKTREFFVEFLKLTKKANRHGEYVLLRDPEGYKGAQLFLGENGCGGTAIEKDGEIVSLLKNEKVCSDSGYKNIGDIIALISVAKGGKKLECWKGFLTEFYIKRLGFIPVTSIPFAKDPYLGTFEWNYERDHTPDIVFCAHNGDKVDQIISRNGTYSAISKYDVRYSDTYDQARYELDEVVKNKKVSEYKNKKEIIPTKVEFAFSR